MTFKRMPDGSMAEVRDDGSLHPVATHTDWARVASWTDEEIEHMAASDPDHPTLDDAFLDDVEARLRARSEPVAIDRDVIDFFRAAGRDVNGRINAVLRDYVATHAKRTGS